MDCVKLLWQNQSQIFLQLIWPFHPPSPGGSVKAVGLSGGVSEGLELPSLWWHWGSFWVGCALEGDLLSWVCMASWALTWLVPAQSTSGGSVQPGLWPLLCFPWIPFFIPFLMICTDPAGPLPLCHILWGCELPSGQGVPAWALAAARKPAQGWQFWVHPLRLWGSKLHWAEDCRAGDPPAHDPGKTWGLRGLWAQSRWLGSAGSRLSPKKRRKNFENVKSFLLNPVYVLKRPLLPLQEPSPVARPGLVRLPFLPGVTWADLGWVGVGGHRKPQVPTAPQELGRRVRGRRSGVALWRRGSSCLQELPATQSLSGPGVGSRRFWWPCLWAARGLRKCTCWAWGQLHPCVCCSSPALPGSSLLSWSLLSPSPGRISRLPPEAPSSAHVMWISLLHREVVLKLVWVSKPQAGLVLVRENLTR